jgi:hypothetical protein
MNDKMREILWQSWENNALEHLQLISQAKGLMTAKSVLIGIDKEKPFQFRYLVHLSAEFVVRSFEVYVDDKLMISMSSDGSGQWVDSMNKRLPDFDGCIDIDITATPFTNTLPIRRLGLKSAESGDIRVVYVDLFERRLYPAEQRYTCLLSKLYRFEMPSIAFTADIPVDKDGFVLDYPNLFRRMWPQV